MHYCDEQMSCNPSAVMNLVGAMRALGRGSLCIANDVSGSQCAAAARLLRLLSKAENGPFVRCHDDTMIGNRWRCDKRTLDLEHPQLAPGK